MKQLPTEYQECRAFYDWCQLNPVLRTIFHIPNEGKRKNGNTLLAIGLKPGVPDYFLPLPNEKYHGLWLEMKRRNASIDTRKNKAQIDFIQKLTAQGYYAAFVFGWEDAANKTMLYLNNKL